MSIVHYSLILRALLFTCLSFRQNNFPSPLIVCSFGTPYNFLLNHCSRFNCIQVLSLCSWLYNFHCHLLMVPFFILFFLSNSSRICSLLIPLSYSSSLSFQSEIFLSQSLNVHQNLTVFTPLSVTYYSLTYSLSFT